MRGTKPHLIEDVEAITDAAAPHWFSEEAVEEWNRVMPILTERRILTVADLGSLENYCVAMGAVRQMEDHLQVHGHVMDVDGTFKRNPAVGIQSDAMTRARLLAAELGLTPVSRSRPVIRDDDDDDSLLD
ncbi:phage terminase small subunit P27 family [Sedimentitalea todarodis]|uniref:Phage terminase small subunit P27 family n=1 Tax=Sedimentitalea todarodis TaxID=1631240 RepID=A0ABU3VJ55_9RHOB|nr:phage terminase small subunit P27 family [Sedimentitalea todarodis]MDU9005744.1 phage terminase small subunit P27 family [Sedimentitalea todarodis]